MSPAGRVPARIGGWLGACFATAACCIAGCAQSDDVTPRQAWEKSIAVRMNGDHAAFWDGLASMSQQEFQRVLIHVQRDPRYLDSMTKKLAVSRDELSAMDARSFFLTLMHAVERDIPGVLGSQLKHAQGAEFIRTEIDEDRAVVYWRSADGRQAETLLLREKDVWKMVLRR
jgi:hypothetical protein